MTKSFFGNIYIDILYTDRRRIYPDGSIGVSNFDPTDRPDVIGRKPDAIGKNAKKYPIFRHFLIKLRVLCMRYELNILKEDKRDRGTTFQRFL